MTKTNLKKEISKILIKWSMPTRQNAINEIVELMQPGSGEGKFPYTGSQPERSQVDLKMEFERDFIGKYPSGYEWKASPDIVWEWFNSKLQKVRQEERKNLLEMLEEKPGESGWSRSFNERLVKQLKSILEGEIC